jgi:uncharacterized coiled-coil protein SlyX
VSLKDLFRRKGRTPEVGSRLAALEQRVGHLERLIEGLQDAVHRESVRTQKQLQELERKTEPGEITRALSRDARERGI